MSFPEREWGVRGGKGSDGLLGHVKKGGWWFAFVGSCFKEVLRILQPLRARDRIVATNGDQQFLMIIID
jgi:hypothetical protein